MPHRFEPLCAIISTIVGFIGMIISAAAAMMDGQQGPIMDDGKMRLVCIIGALGGGLLSALIFSPPKTTGRGFALKVITSSLASVLFTPLAIHWLGWMPNVDTLLGFSAALALVGIGVIRTGVPLWQKHILSKIEPPQE